MFIQNEVDFFETFQLSSFLHCKSFYSFEDIFYLDKEELLDLYYSLPIDTFAFALKDSSQKDKFLSLVDNEEKEEIKNLMKLPHDSKEAKHNVEKQFIEGLFVHGEFEFSQRLINQKSIDIVRFIFNIYFFLKSEAHRDNIISIINVIPFWISAKIIDLLPCEEGLKYLSFLEEYTLIKEPCCKIPNILAEVENIQVERRFFTPFYNIFTSINLDFLLRFISSDVNVKVILNKGRSMFASNDYKSALFLNKAYVIRDDFFSAWYYGRELFKRGEKEKAAKYYHQALEKKPFLNKYHLFNASSLRNHGKMIEAQWELEMLTFLAPDYICPFKLLGYIYLVQEEFSSAINCYEKALCEGDINLYMSLIDAYLYNDELEKAKEYALKLPDLFNNNEDRVNIYFKLGEIFNNLEDKEKALIYYKKSLEINKDFLPSINGLSLLLISMGNKTEGKEFLLRAVALQPQVIWLRKKLADMYIDEGKTDEAADELKYIKDTFGEDEEAVKLFMDMYKKPSP